MRPTAKADGQKAEAQAVERAAGGAADDFGSLAEACRAQDRRLYDDELLRVLVVDVVEAMHRMVSSEGLTMVVRDCIAFFE